MRKLKETIEARANSQKEAVLFCEEFKEKASKEHYIVGQAGYTYKAKKKKGVIVDEAWVCKCVKIYSEVWDEEY